MATIKIEVHDEIATDVLDYCLEHRISNNHNDGSNILEFDIDDVDGILQGMEHVEERYKELVAYVEDLKGELDPFLGDD